MQLASRVTWSSGLDDLQGRLQRETAMLDQEGNTEGSGQGVAVSLVCRSGLQVQPEFSRPRSFVVGRRLDENDSAAMLNSVNSI